MAPPDTPERDFDESTLWRISGYELRRAELGHSGFARLHGNSVLPTSMQAELTRLERTRRSADVVEVIAACLRHRESALVLLQHDGLVWPLTLFPQQNLYHLPRALVESLTHVSRDMAVLAIEPPGLRPPGHTQQERVADGPGYRRLPPLLWKLALHAPATHLLDEIAGHAAYRLTAQADDEGMLGGALRSSFSRLRTEIASLRDIAAWPGMDADRATRLLNGAYLQGGLMVLRAHQRASSAEEPSGKSLLARWRQGR